MNKTWYRWAIAYAYFVLVFLVGWQLGVIDVLIRHPLGSHVERMKIDSWEFGKWLICSQVLITYGLIGYWVLWTNWTNNYGRPFSWFSLLLMGIPTGLEEGLVWITFWRLVHTALTSIWKTPAFLNLVGDSVSPSSWQFKLLVAIGMIVLESMYGRVFHEKFWDIYVSPSHNIRATNTRKVLSLHVPISTLTFVYMAWYESAAIVLLVAVAAMSGSVFGMRFPPPWYPTEWPTPDPQGIKSDEDWKQKYMVECDFAHQV